MSVAVYKSVIVPRWHPDLSHQAEMRRDRPRAKKPKVENNENDRVFVQTDDTFSGKSISSNTWSKIQVSSTISVLESSRLSCMEIEFIRQKEAGKKGAVDFE